MPEYNESEHNRMMEAPSKAFRSVEFREVLERASSWDCYLKGAILRVEDPDSGIISEKHCKTEAKASKELMRLEDAGLIVTMYNSNNLYCTEYLSDDDSDEDA